MRVRDSEGCEGLEETLIFAEVTCEWPQTKQRARARPVNENEPRNSCGACQSSLRRSERGEVGVGKLQRRRLPAGPPRPTRTVSVRVRNGVPVVPVLVGARVT